MGLWWWPAFGPDAAPLPSLDGSFDHSHDLLLGIPAAVLGPAIPEDAASALQAFPGRHDVGRQLRDRTATAWLDEQVMFGGMNGWSADAEGQHHPAVGHWQLPGGGVGHLRVRHAGPVDAIVTEGRITASIQPSEAATVLELHVGEDVDTKGLRRRLTAGPEIREGLQLPGLDLDLRVSRAASDVAVQDGLARISWNGADERLILLLNVV
jgi:hypothetical protein